MHNIKETEIGPEKLISRLDTFLYLLRKKFDSEFAKQNNSQDIEDEFLDELVEKIQKTKNEIERDYTENKLKPKQINDSRLLIRSLFKIMDEFKEIGVEISIK
ncbi:MAG: hypothetical protein ABIG10_01980 [bacterium]